MPVIVTSRARPRRDALLAAISLNRGELDPARLLRLLGRIEQPARREGFRRGRR